MTHTTEQLDLDIDPFEAGAQTGHFFPGAQRQELLDQLIELCNSSSDLLLVTGALGSGKTTLAQWLAHSLEDAFVSARVQATLFMSPEQLLESLCNALGLEADSDADADELLAQLDSYADSLNARARTLQLLIDDAHELGEEALQVLLELIERQADPSRMGEDGIKAVLLGEPLLLNSVAQLLPAAYQVLELEPLDSDETAEYLAFKLGCAGHEGPLPLDSETIEALHARSHGMPGAIDLLVRDLVDVVISEQDRVPELGFVERHLVAASVLFGTLILALFFTLGRDRGPDPEDTGTTLAANTQPVSIGSGQVRVDIPLSLERSVPLTDASPESAAASLPAGGPAATSRTGQDRAGTTPATGDDTQRPQVAASIAPPVTAADPAVVQVDPSPRQLEAVAVKPAARPPERQQRPAPAGGEALLSQAPGSYTLQVLGSHSEASVRRFIDAQPDSGRLNYFESRYQEKPWYVVVYGNFPSREAAQAAIDRLPEALQELKPWARNLADIQSAIRSIQ